VPVVPVVHFGQLLVHLRRYSQNDQYLQFEMSCGTGSKYESIGIGTHILTDTLDAGASMVTLARDTLADLALSVICRKQEAADSLLLLQLPQ